MECPTFDLLPPGETWSQQFAPTNLQSSDAARNSPAPSLLEPCITSGYSIPKHDGNHNASLAPQNSIPAQPTNDSQPKKIVFNKEMVVKALGIPRGTRPVVLTGEHEESPHRDFYRIQYKTAGMRSPIYHAEKLLANDDLDDETWFRTFYLVVIGTYFFPGTSSMLPLEYLGSLGDSNIVCEYDWADQIFRHTMSGIKCFQDRCRKADKIGNTNPMWAGGCLPWIAIVYMDHLDFPVSTLSTHRINYAVPRASNISDADFKFVVKHDKSRLTLSPHTYGTRPFRAFNVTPYSFVDTNLGNQAFEALSNLQQNKEVPITHSVQEASPQHGTHTFSSAEGLPEYLKTIQEKYTSLWREDVDRLTKLHDKHMSQFASEVIAAIKQKSTSTEGLYSPPRATTPVTSPLRAPNPIISSPTVEQPVFGEEGAQNSDPKTTPNTQFWVEASKIAEHVEQSAGKSANTRDASNSRLAHTENESNGPATHTRFRGDDMECPTFDLLPPGETWSQQFAPTNLQSSDAARNSPAPSLLEPCITSGYSIPKHDGNHNASLAPQNSIPAQPTNDSQPKKIGAHTHPENSKPSAAKNTTTTAPAHEDGQYDFSSILLSPQPPSVHRESQPSKLGVQTRGSIQKHPSEICVTTTTPTLVDKQNDSPAIKTSQIPPSANDCQPSELEKKNRKKRAFLGINNEANRKILKKLKATDVSKDIYDTYITRRCIRLPLVEEERPPFVDFGKYHISYEDFREALKPRGRIDTHVMELYIRHFNLISNLYFAVVDSEHWVLVSINLLHKQVNFLDSMINAKKNKVYEKAHNLVDNFITLASHVKAFPRTNFSQFIQNNPQDLRQQTTIFDCGVFVMLFMKMWDGKTMKPFDPDILQHRMVLTHMIMTSELNKANPTWVLKKK
uniref:Uncharacterized protein n=1 Tax=Avena sativa TaxID=4498 RepID=A0ACD6AIZ3_AVESA